MDAAWYISANNREFGPYGHEQMKTFALEKRLAPYSLVRKGSDGPFVPAERHAALSRLFEADCQLSPGVAHRPVPKPERERTQIVGMAEGEASNFVVLVDLRTGSLRLFENEIKTLGRIFRLNQQAWLLQSERSANSIKTALAPYVGVEDPLLIIDAGRNRLAWHNRGVFEASSVRELWKLAQERA